MNIDSELFGNFAFHAGLLAVKTLCMTGLTIRMRFKKKNPISREDAALRKAEKIGIGQDDDVERIRRAHQNDIENVFPFLTLGFVYLFTNPSIITAKLLFRIFSAARLIHTVVYVNEGSVPTRMAAFFTGIGINMYLGGSILNHFIKAW